MTEVRWQAEAIYMQQRGQSGFNTLKFRPIVALDESLRLIPTIEPVIEATDDVRRATSIRVKTPRPERRDQLSYSNLSVTHNLLPLTGSVGWW